MFKQKPPFPPKSQTLLSSFGEKTDRHSGYNEKINELLLILFTTLTIRNIKSHKNRTRFITRD